MALVLGIRQSRLDRPDDHNMKSKRITISVNVCTKFQSNPSFSCFKYFSQNQTTVVDRPGQNARRMVKHVLRNVILTRFVVCC